MPFQKGKPRHPNAGRKPGSSNKTTAAVKDALDKAFNKLGGVKSLADWAGSNQTEFYKLWVKMLPQEVKADISGELAGSSIVTEIIVRSREEAESVLRSLTAPSS